MTEEPMAEMHALDQLRSSFDATFGRQPESCREREAVIQVRVGSELFVVRTRHIAGLVKPRRIVALPSRIPELLGIAAVRGSLIPVYDLAALLGISQGAGTPSWLMLVPCDTPIGLAFDGFEGRQIPEWLCDETNAPRQVRQLVRVGSAVREVLDIPGISDAVRQRAGLPEPAKERKQ